MDGWLFLVADFPPADFLHNREAIEKQSLLAGRTGLCAGNALAVRISLPMTGHAATVRRSTPDAFITHTKDNGRVSRPVRRGETWRTRETAQSNQSRRAPGRGVHQLRHPRHSPGWEAARVLWRGCEALRLLSGLGLEGTEERPRRLRHGERHDSFPGRQTASCCPGEEDREAANRAATRRTGSMAPAHPLFVR